MSKRCLRLDIRCLQGCSAMAMAILNLDTKFLSAVVRHAGNRCVIHARWIAIPYHKLPSRVLDLTLVRWFIELHTSSPIFILTYFLQPSLLPYIILLLHQPLLYRYFAHTIYIHMADHTPSRFPVEWFDRRELVYSPQPLVKFLQSNRLLPYRHYRCLCSGVHRFCLQWNASTAASLSRPVNSTNRNIWFS